MRTERFCPECRAPLDAELGICLACHRTANAAPAITLGAPQTPGTLGTPQTPGTRGPTEVLPRKPGPVPSRAPLPAAAAVLPAALTDRFESRGVLGWGGMGAVHRVQDLRLGREVALKLLLDATPLMAQLFEREARMLAALEHDHVVRLYDFGVAGGHPFLVMELVRGVPLSTRLAEGRPAVQEAARLARDALRGIAAAHQLKIIHRDLKPANIFLDATGRAKVADFGIARMMFAPDDAAGKPDDALELSGATDGSLMGTPGYMAPELWRGEPAGPAGDVYALGVMLHEMLTGRRLFVSSDLAALMRVQGASAPSAPSAVNPGVPPALDLLVSRCLEPLPGNRPTAAEALAMVESWLATARPARHSGAALPAEPYKFLAHFEAADAPVFFGRDAEVHELAALVESESVRLVSVFGPCGAGKSSLLRAGLLPALDPARFEPLVLAPGPDAARRVQEALDGRAPDRTLVLVLDQLEELFTQNPRGSPRVGELFGAVAALVESEERPVRVVLSYRTEFRGDFFPLEERLARHARAFAVREAGPPALLEAIEGPSRLPGYGFSFEPGLAERIAADIGEASQQGAEKALPVMQIVCRQLFDRMRVSKRARIDAGLYEALAGTRGALDRYVEERLASAEYAAGGALARQLLKALTVKEDTGERFARALDEEELLDFPDRDAARLALERLIRDHLVVRESGEGRRRVRLVSEVICPLVDGWQLEPDEAERAARTLARACRTWDQHGRRPEDLLAGRALALVERHRSLFKEVSAREAGFLVDSQRARRSRYAGLGVLSLALLTVTGWLVWAAFLRPGTVELVSVPPGATVRHQDRVLGVTPFRWSAWPGAYRLSLEASRYTTAIVEVRVPAGGEASYQPVLPYTRGILSLTSAPAGALCTARPHGGGPPPLSAVPTPLTTELPAGTYDLELAHPGHVPRTLAGVAVRPNRELTLLSTRLERDTGSLMVACVFDGLQMRVEDAATGEVVQAASLPLRQPLELPRGDYRVIASSSRHHHDRRTVRLERGQDRVLTVWTPPTGALWSEPRNAMFLKPADGPVAPATLAELDERPGPEVLVARRDRLLTALHGSVGRTLWSTAVPAPIGAAPACGDLDGDRRADAVVVCEDGSVCARRGADGAPLWTRALGAATRSFPVVADLDGDRLEDVVAGAEDGVLSALSGKDGAPLWTARAGGPLRCGAAISNLDGKGGLEVVCGDESGTVRALTAAGVELWTHAAGTPVRSPVLLAQLDGKPGLEVVFGGASGLVRALDGATGQPLWSFKAGGEVRGACTAVDLDGDALPEVVAPAMDGRLHALSRSGQPLWTVNVGRPLPHGVVPVRVDTDGVPDLLLAGPDDHLRAFSGRDGRMIWSAGAQGLEMTAAPALGDMWAKGVPAVVVRSHAEVAAAFLLETETVDWAYQFADTTWRSDRRPAWFALADLDGDEHVDAVLSSGDGGLLGLSGRDGSRLWSRALPGLTDLPATTVDLDGDGLTEVVLASRTGQMLALAPRTGAELWRLPLGQPATTSPNAGDLDGDGTPDLAVGLEKQVRAISGATHRPLWSFDLPTRTGMLALGDVDGDGLADVAVSLGNQAVGVLRGRTGKPLWAQEKQGYCVPGPLLAQLNADRIADVVVPSKAGALVAHDGRTGAVHWRLEGIACHTLPQLGEVDGQPGDDVVETTATGQLHAVSGAGRKLWVCDLGLELFNAILTDLDGDGRQDALAQSRGGHVFAVSSRGEVLGRVASQVSDFSALGVRDPATFRAHGRVLWSAGSPATQTARSGPGSGLYSLRNGLALVASRFATPSLTRWGAPTDLTSAQRPFVSSPPAAQ